MFTPGDAIGLVIRCLRAIAGRAEPMPISPSSKLQTVGVTTSQEIDLLKDLIVNDPDVGLGAYGRRLDKQALEDLEPSWTVEQVADVVFDLSVPV